MTAIERGGIYTMAAKGAYTGKPRPAIVVQTDALALDSIIVIPITRDFVDAPSIRIALEPSTTNGLKARSWAMCDKISTIPSANLGERIGTAGIEEMRHITSALLLILELSD